MIAPRIASLVAALVLTSPAALIGQPAQQTFGAFGSLGFGAYGSDESSNGSGVSFGASIDVFALNWLGLEAGVDGGSHGREYSSGVRWDGNTLHVYADLIFRFAPRSRFQPYLIGGVGRLHSATTRSEPLGRSFDSEEDSFAFNLGLGALWHVARRWSIRPELRLVGSSSYEAITRYLRFSMGVGYYFF